MNARHAGQIRAVCIGCGCDDFHACEGGCWWLRVDYVEGLGVCSECADREEAWDRGDRTPHAEPIEQLELDQGDAEILPAAADSAPRRYPDGRCDHWWPRASPRDSDSCARCHMSFTRYIFTECP